MLWILTHSTGGSASRRSDYVVGSSPTESLCGLQALRLLLGAAAKMGRQQWRRRQMRWRKMGRHPHPR
jgi:hypothetical protein